MKDISMGLQLYSVRQALKQDYLGTLEKVKKMGYEGVEFCGPFLYKPQELRDMLARVGLKIAGWHTGYADVQGERFDEVLAYHKAIGNESITVPAIPKEVTASLDGWKQVAKTLGEAAKKAADHGIFLGYHNHAVEFAPVDGQLPWDVIFAGAPKELCMQLDTGNAMSGGADVEMVLKTYPGRSHSIHIKPYQYGLEEGFATMIGQDSQPYAFIKSYCQGDITRWYIVEYECYDLYDPMTGSEKCAEELKKLGF